jgi:hypothetical protein
MATRETYPAQLFPLRGDLSAEAGDTLVTVVGLQTTPIDPETPGGTNVSPAVSSPALVALGGSTLTQATWTPVLLDNSILVDAVPVSDDYSFLVNGVDLNSLVGWAYGFAFQVFLDGVGVTGTGT